VSATVSELRQALRSTRRVVVPLLEKPDRERVTRRQGDRRCLHEPGAEKCLAWTAALPQTVCKRWSRQNDES
jgi:hypothetical protein